MTAAELVAAARRTGDWRGLAEAVPYLRFLGLRMEEGGGQLFGHLPFSQHLVGNPMLPAVHGGVLGAALEAMAQFELLYRADTVVQPKTITITIDFLRSGRPQDVFVRARAVKQGKRVTTVQSLAWQEDEGRPIALATVHLLILGA